jgi:hypothetical protein
MFKESAMSVPRVTLFALMLVLGSLAFAQGDKSPEQVVREYAATWNAGELDAFLALHSHDVRKYRRTAATSEFELTTTGRDVVREKYQPLFARTPRVRVEIADMTVLGEIVVTRDRVSGASDGHVSHELTMYQVRDGLIHNIWYLGRAIE